MQGQSTDRFRRLCSDGFRYSYGVFWAVSVFALTSLDTGTRLSRFMFAEMFLKEDEKTWKDASGIRRFLAHPLVGTLFMVVIGCILGGLKLSAIWSLFGAANQLLAVLAVILVIEAVPNLMRRGKTEKSRI